MRSVLGLDIGTSGCKCMLLDDAGRTVSTRSTECYPLFRTDGTVEQNPDDWYTAVLECLGAMAALDGVDLSQVGAVCVTGQMQGITLLGDDGRPVRNSILWNDNRCEAETADLNRKHRDLFIHRINFPASTSLTVSKIEWLRNHEPDSWLKTAKFLFASSYIGYRLTGRIVVDENNITCSGLNDSKRNTWSAELLDACRIERSKVPDLVGCFDVIGTVTTGAAAETGLAAGTPVVAGGGDAAVETYPIGTAGKPGMKIRLGTAASLNGLVPVERIRDREVWPGFRDIRREYMLIGSYTKACAASIKWMRDVFYSEMPQVGDTYAVMDREAASVPAGSDGLIYHPYLAGESSPYFDPSLRAKFNGITIGHRRPHFMRAVYEGVSFSIREAFESVEEFRTVEEIVVVGGGTKSRIWIAILADVMGRDLVLLDTCDAAYGAALMAGQGAGIFDAGEIILRNRKQSRTVGHDAENHVMYDRIFMKYRALARN